MGGAGICDASEPHLAHTSFIEWALEERWALFWTYFVEGQGFGFWVCLFSILRSTPRAKKQQRCTQEVHPEADLVVKHNRHGKPKCELPIPATHGSTSSARKWRWTECIVTVLIRFRICLFAKSSGPGRPEILSVLNLVENQTTCKPDKP